MIDVNPDPSPFGPEQINSSPNIQQKKTQLKGEFDDEEFDQLDEDMDMEERKEIHFIEGGSNPIAHFGLDAQGR